MSRRDGCQENLPCFSAARLSSRNRCSLQMADGSHTNRLSRDVPKSMCAHFLDLVESGRYLPMEGPIQPGPGAVTSCSTENCPTTTSWSSLIRSRAIHSRPTNHGSGRIGPFNFTLACDGLTFTRTETGSPYPQLPRA